MIATRGLRNPFGDHVMRDGITLEVAPRTIFALFGPNGAGKTKVVQMLSTMISAASSTTHVAGHDVARDPNAVRAVIGVTSQLADLSYVTVK